MSREEGGAAVRGRKTLCTCWQGGTPEQEHVVASQIVNVLRALQQHQLRDDRNRL